MESLNIADWGKHKVLWVDSHQLGASIAAAQHHTAGFVGISPHHGFRGESLDFLKQHPEIRGLVLPFAKNLSLKPLKHLEGLQHLTIAESREPLDLGWFPKVTELRLEWHPRIEFNGLRHLKALYLRGYKPPSGDLTELPELPNLSHLELNQAEVQALSGVEKFSRLRKLELFHLRRLLSVSDLCAAEIEFLQIENCKKIGDVESLRCLSTLKMLRLNDCGRLATLQFLDDIPALEEFRFVDTIVEDGDLRPLLRLRQVGFRPRRGYSHTPEQVDAAIRSRRTDT